MENEKENKFLFIIATTLLAVLILMVLVKLFVFDKNKQEVEEIPESLIKELYSYIDINNVTNNSTYYFPHYLDNQNIDSSVVSKMTYNYIKNYDNLKIKVVNDEDKKLFTKNGTLETKISKSVFLEKAKYLVDKNNYYLEDFDIDSETSAYVSEDNVYIYKRNDIKDNEYIYYRGLMSYTVMDNNDTIKITEYYLNCNKNTKECFNGDSNNKVKSGITYSETLDPSKKTGNLVKYTHTFKKEDGHYKWVNVEPLQ